MVSSSKYFVLGAFYIFLTMFSLVSTLIVSPKPALAADAKYGNNRLYLVGKNCHDLNNIGYIFTTNQNGAEGCSEWEERLDRELGCSGKMFYQHEADDGDKKWYTKQGEFKECYNRAAAQIQLIEEKCKKVKNDTDLWNDKCEDNQDHLYEALGCNKNMFTDFKDNGTKYWKPIAGSMQDCKNRLASVASLKLIKIGADGKPSESDKPIGDPSVASSSSDPGEDGSKQEPSCDASFANPLSWILCPVMEMGAKITAGVFQYLVTPLLQGTPVGIDSNNDFYKVWQSFRLIANILLIGVLLILVLSQLTEGWGINAVDAYTAKKMAPRILIGIIAINISIYLCVAAIDITNVIGNGMNYLLTKPFIVAGAYDAQTEGNTESAIVGTLGGGLAAGAITAIVSAGAVGGALTLLGLYVLIPILIIVSFAALAVLFTLVVRFALVVLLTIISPIAIACFILPGTEKYFKVWWTQFLKTLMVYPIIAVIFALANIMSVIFITNSTKTNDSVGIISLLIGVVAVFTPMFLIPFSFKLAGGMIGSVGNMASNFTSGLSKRTNKKFGELRNTRGNIIGNAAHSAKENLDTAGLSAGAIGSGLGGAREGRRGVRGFRNNLAAMRTGYNAASGSREGTHVVDTAMDYMKNSHTFAAFSNDDDKLWAGIRGDNFEEIRRELVNRSHARFGADNADGTYSAERQQGLDTAAMEVWRAKQEAGKEVFDNAAGLGLSTSGTGLDYSETGDHDNKYALINQLAGNNRGHAARLLGEFRKNLGQTDRADQVGSFTDDITNLEASHTGALTAEQATADHYDHTADSMGGSMLNMKETAFRRNMLPSMQRNMVRVLGDNSEGAGRRAIQEFATLAGKLDAAGYANPKIARDLADMMNNTQVDIRTLPPHIRDRMIEGFGGVAPADGQMNYSEVFEALRTDPDFGQIRREYGSRAREEAAAAGRGEAGPPGT